MTDHDEPITGDEADVSDRSMDKDDVFHLLQNSRRRAVVRYFASSDGPVSIGDLADEVAARECETEVEDVTDAQRQRVYIALYQSHLDKLDANGVVEYDDDQGTVTVGPAFDDLRAHLAPGTVERTDAESTPAVTDTNAVWASGYLGIALGGFVPVSGRLLNVVPSDAVSLQALNVVLVVACIVLACTQYFTSR